MNKCYLKGWNPYILMEHLCGIFTTANNVVIAFIIGVGSHYAQG
jgi:hypothetical protein